MDELRELWTDELIVASGPEWVEAHRELLEAQWSFLVECHFLD